MKQKSIIWRVLALLFFAFLWGGSLEAHAEKKVWAILFPDPIGKNSITIQYSEEPTGFQFHTEVTIEDGHIPEWSKYLDGTGRVTFDGSFADYHPKSCYKWFAGAKDLNMIYGSNYLNTSEVETMESMFEGCSELYDFILNYFKTSNVKKMNRMFKGCSSDRFRSLGFNGSKFDTSNVTDMSEMFSGCSGLESLDVSEFNTANVTNMSGMFSGCSDLESLDVSNFNTANVTNMSDMFNGCSSLSSVSLDVSKFNT